MPEPDLSKLHSDPHPLPHKAILANPNPIYYIDARRPGYAQTAFDNEKNPQQQTEVKYIQADTNVRITLERTYPLGRRYHRNTQNSELLVFNVAPRVVRPEEQKSGYVSPLANACWK